MTKTTVSLHRQYEFPEETKTRNQITVTFPPYIVEQVMEPQKYKSDNWQETCNRFIFTIKGRTFDYYTGIGHRELTSIWSTDKEDYKHLKYKNLTESGFRKLLSITRATMPSLEDLFYNLVMDSSAANQPFSSWCGDLGYDTDSRKALRIYEECQENAVKMCAVSAPVTLDKLRGYFSDY